MILKLLPTGYYHARWNGEVWCQWPRWRSPTLDDFFHKTGTEEKLREIENALEQLQAELKAEGDKQ